MAKRTWRREEDLVLVGSTLEHGVWYRSPLWNDDHLLGRWKEHVSDELSWCGRALGVAAGWADGEDLSGLFLSQRASGKCAYCKSKEEDADE